jgi:lipoprotein-anchoring transpeptidase ErfK/SrfK
VKAWAIVAAALAAAALAAVVLSPWHGGKPAKPPSPSLGVEAARLPPPERPAFSVGTPRLLNRRETVAHFAAVLHPVTARAEPGADGRPLAALSTETPEGTTNLVLVEGQRPERDAVWVSVRLPVLPNNATGWVPRSALGAYQFVHTHVVVDRERFRLSLYDDGRRIFTAPVGVGTPQAPTPAGEFYIRDRLSGFGDPFYGPVAFGTSARSAVLTDWPDGGFIGIHGTNEPELIPGRISHGCIRLRNRDILQLRRLLPVGTPVTIR